MPCGPWCSNKFTGASGPKPIFSAAHPDGMLDSYGAVFASARLAMAVVHAACAIADAALNGGAELMWEHPVCQSYGSFYSKGCEQHSTALQTTPVRQLTDKWGLVDVYTDRCRSGGHSRQSTVLLSSGRLARQLRPVLGVLRCDPAVCTHGNPDLTGKDADGSYRTKSKEAFTALFCERLALCMVRSVSAAAAGGADDGNAANVHAHATVPTGGGQDDAADDDSYQYPDGHPGVGGLQQCVGARVEVFWSQTINESGSKGRWFAGKITGVGYTRARLKGRMVDSPGVILRSGRALSRSFVFRATVCTKGSTGTPPHGQGTPGAPPHGHKK